MNTYNCKEDKQLNNLPNDDIIDSLAKLFKVFGEQSRVKILYTISKKEACVLQIAEKLNMNHSAVSHQLKILKNNRLVRSRKEGKMVYYSIDDSHINNIFYQGLEHIMEVREEKKSKK